MPVPIDFEDCIKDSPHFRGSLVEKKHCIYKKKKILEKLVKLCTGMIDTGKAYNAANQLFVGGVNELLMHCGRDNTIMTLCTKLLVGGYDMLFDQIQRSIKTQLQNFIAQSSLNLNSTSYIPLSSKPNSEVYPTSLILFFNGFMLQKVQSIKHLGMYLDGVLSYNVHINIVKCRISVAFQIMSYFHSQFTFFHQGYDLSKDLEPLMKSVSSQLDRLSVDSAAQRRELEYRHSVVQQRDVASDTRMEFLSAPSRGVAIEGYLFKRSKFRVFLFLFFRRWFTVKDNRLSYQKSLKVTPTSILTDTPTCTHTKTDSKSVCVRVSSPLPVSCMLQADSESLRHAWVQAVQSSIDTAYRERSDLEPPEVTTKRCGFGIRRKCLYLTVESNHCGLPVRAPSVKGHVESQGQGQPGVPFNPTKQYFFRILNTKKVICGLGNDVINSIYESRWEETGDVKAAADSPRLVKESWIKSKYVEKKFVKRRTTAASGNQSVLILRSTREAQLEIPKPVTKMEHCSDSSLLHADQPTNQRKFLPESLSLSLFPEGHTHGDSAADTLDPSELHPGMRLYRAALEGDLPSMAEALAHGADVNWVNKEEDGKTPLIISTCGGSLVSSEFLLQNGANVNYRDKKGRGAIHAATYQGHTGPSVCCLYCVYCNSSSATLANMISTLYTVVEPGFATGGMHTKLRMARMNEEMRDSEGVFGGMGDDETFQDIFRDFSHMASHDPEKLARRKPGLASS
uniref:Arf-GAP with coiled-coil, ANK repeat and PH domain-containing protein n=1 Tax=Latimeria chalumnae TaxID=7897 RepID=H2ZWC9_LATCH